jgi:hypothetical protein
MSFFVLFFRVYLRVYVYVACECVCASLVRLCLESCLVVCGSDVRFIWSSTKKLWTGGRPPSPADPTCI